MTRMTTKQIANLDPTAKVLGLTPTQKASFDMSIAWKKASRNLFDSARNGKDFANAVHWCGKMGNVVRTVPKEKFASFAAFLYDHFDQIKDGTFRLDEVPSYERLPSKKTGEVSEAAPYSWVSKICHIVNPVAYPVIYDSRIRAILGIMNVNEFIPFSDAIKEDLGATGADEEVIYEIDSLLWAI